VGDHIAVCVVRDWARMAALGEGLVRRIFTPKKCLEESPAGRQAAFPWQLDHARVRTVNAALTSTPPWTPKGHESQRINLGVASYSRATDDREDRAEWSLRNRPTCAIRGEVLSNLKIPDIRQLKPRITVFGVGGAGGNALNNMINAGLQGVDFVVANTDAQALGKSRAERIVQMGVTATGGLGAGSQPDVGRAAAEEVIDEICDHLTGAHMVFVTAGMGGGTGTGGSPVVARAARELGILTVGVVTKPFHFEGQRRMRLAESGIIELQKSVDTLIIIPNQNLFRVANEKTTFADAFAMADQVLYSGVACITDLVVKEGLINLNFADVRAVMREMGKAMMGTGEASGDKRALRSAEAAICNPLIDNASLHGARGVLISITGGKDLTLYEVDEAATRIREEVDADANIIVGATFDDSLEGIIPVSVVATGLDVNAADARPVLRSTTEFSTHAQS
jgi:cell division protein FtsZ